MSVWVFSLNLRAALVDVQSSSLRLKARIRELQYAVFAALIGSIIVRRLALMTSQPVETFWPPG